MEIVAIALALLFIVLIALLLFFAAIKIVNQYERILIFTLGRTSPEEVKGPGWVFVVPIVQRAIRVDLREKFIEVPSQTSITKDNAPISIDFLIYWRIAQPYMSVVEVVDFNGALQNIATTTLRAVIGDILLDDVLSKREQINEVLRVKLDEVTERWGGKVTTVEIREITPPRDVQDAMNRQLSAERTRRAVITESEGSRQSAINVAEGTKQAEILRAEGDRQAAILRAEGFALAITRIYQAASQVDQKTMALQYLDAFKALGASPSTKYIIPLEITQLGEAFRGYLMAANEPGPVGGGSTAEGGSAFIEPGPAESSAPQTGPEGPAEAPAPDDRYRTSAADGNHAEVGEVGVPAAEAAAFSSPSGGSGIGARSAGHLQARIDPIAVLQAVGMFGCQGDRAVIEHEVGDFGHVVARCVEAVVPVDDPSEGDGARPRRQGVGEDPGGRHVGNAMIFGDRTAREAREIPKRDVELEGPGVARHGRSRNQQAAGKRQDRHESEGAGTEHDFCF